MNHGSGVRGWDVINTAHYFETLNLFKDRPTMTLDQLKRAERYAFHFFFRRMIRISLFSDPYSIDWLFPKRNLKLSELIGSNDLNFQKILEAIDNSLTPLGVEI